MVIQSSPDSKHRTASFTEMIYKKAAAWWAQRTSMSSFSTTNPASHLTGVLLFILHNNNKTLIFNDKNEGLGEFFAYDSEMQKEISEKIQKTTFKY